MSEWCHCEGCGKPMDCDDIYFVSDGCCLNCITDGPPNHDSQSEIGKSLAQSLENWGKTKMQKCPRCGVGNITGFCVPCASAEPALRGSRRTEKRDESALA